MCIFFQGLDELAPRVSYLLSSCLLEREGGRELGGRTCARGIPAFLRVWPSEVAAKAYATGASPHWASLAVRGLRVQGPLSSLPTPSAPFLVPSLPNVFLPEP